MKPMQHDFSDSDYCEALLNLFKPGSGARPPRIGGRAAEQTLLSRYLRTAQGEADEKGRLESEIPHDIILYGPRGNGKTALLRQFERAGHAQHADIVPLTPDKIKTPKALAKKLLDRPADRPAHRAAPAEAPTGGLQEKVMDKAKGIVAGVEKASEQHGLQVTEIAAKTPVAAVSWGQLSSKEKLSRLDELLLARCRGKERPPLVISLDEAHNLDPEVGNQLLNLSQTTRGQGGRFLLVLAGTPNLEAHLGKMDATFWDRSEVVPLGRLDAAATRDALVGPLQKMGVDFDEDALARVVADSQHYPYFIQLWGKALCEVLVKTKQGQQITASVADEAWTVVEERREQYYSGRYNEMKEQDLLPAAGALADAFEGEEVVHEEILLHALSRELGLSEKAGRTCLGQLAALGYLWHPDPDDNYEPGIPSLMTHVQQRLQTKAAAKARARQMAPDAKARPDAENQDEDRNDDGGDTPKGMGQGQT